MIKCTMLINVLTNVSDDPQVSTRQGGFSESTYYNSDTFGTTITRFEGVCMRRAALLPRGAEIVGQRYQIVNPVGVSQTVSKRFPAASNLAADYPSLALLCTVPTLSTRNIGRLFIRAIPDARIVEGEYSPSAQFRAALLAYFFSLRGFSIKVRDIGLPAYPIMTISNVGAYQLEGNANFPEGTMVRVLRSFNVAGQNVSGRFRVGPGSGAGTGTLQNWTAGACEGGKLRQDSTIYPVIFDSEIQLSRIITKKVGRPFNGFVGRR